MRSPGAPLRSVPTSVSVFTSDGLGARRLLQSQHFARFVFQDAGSRTSPGLGVAPPGKGGPWAPQAVPRCPVLGHLTSGTHISLQLGFAEKSRTWSLISSLFKELS